MNKYCNICIRRILSHAKTIKCIICLETCHIKCITLNPEEQLNLLAQPPSWYCATCIGNTSPFNHFIDDDEFYQSLFTKDYLMPFMSNLPGDMFSHIDITLNNHESPLDDIDPDLNYYNELHFLNGVNCSYLNEDSLKKMYDSQKLKTRKSSLSLFHMNIRSIPRNINAMSDYIDCLNVDFHVIGISETWLKEDNCGLYDIPGYHCKEKHRPSKVGGGVAIYVKDFMSFIPREDLSVFNDLVEMVFIEIYGGDLTDGKNVIVGEVYRPPGQDLTEFNQIMQELPEKVQKEIRYAMSWAISTSIF